MSNNTICFIKGISYFFKGIVVSVKKIPLGDWIGYLYFSVPTLCGAALPFIQWESPLINWYNYLAVVGASICLGFLGFTAAAVVGICVLKLVELLQKIIEHFVQKGKQAEAQEAIIRNRQIDFHFNEEEQPQQLEAPPKNVLSSFNSVKQELRQYIS